MRLLLGAHESAHVRGQVGNHGLEGNHLGPQVEDFVLRLACGQQLEHGVGAPRHEPGLLLVIDVAKVAVDEVGGARVPMYAHPGLKRTGNCPLPAQAPVFVGYGSIPIALEEVVPRERRLAALKLRLIKVEHGRLRAHL